MKRLIVWLSMCVSVAYAGDPIEEALKEVRDVKADMYSTQSSVLGELFSPAELATIQLKARPIPRPRAGSKSISFDAKMTAALVRDVQAFRDKSATSKSRVAMVMPLGITGAQIRDVLGCKELLIIHVLPNTPASGVLKADDVIVGANGRLLECAEDPRPELGFALSESQSPELKGVLTLQIVRDDKPLNVSLDLGNSVHYSPTWPYDCEKTKQVRKSALECVLKHSKGDGRYAFWTPLFLMASGDPAALELARRIVYSYIQPLTTDRKVGGTWANAYCMISLCEYYLLTGDSAVLPEIKARVKGIEWAQFASGGWSHGAPGGYGEINNVGLTAFMSLILARECGAEVSTNVMVKAIRYFGKYCGSNLGYGLGAVGGRAGRMDNGLSSEAAIVFHLLGEEEMARRWARTVCYMWMGRDKGHAEGLFNMAWGPVGAALAPKEEFQMFMDEMSWYYELGRTRDNGFVYFRGSHFPYPHETTGAMALFMYLPEKRVRVLGAGKSVFTIAPPKGLEKAAALYKEKKWSEMERAIQSSGASGGEYAKRMIAAYVFCKASVAETLKSAQANIALERKRTAKTQLEGLLTFWGNPIPEATRLLTSLGSNVQDKAEPKPLFAAMNPEWKKNLKLGGEFAYDPAVITDINLRGFSGMSATEIARGLAHFSSGAASACFVALAGKGEEALPLINRLLKDKHPYVVGGALFTIAEMNRNKKLSAQEELALIKKISFLFDDANPEVQRGIGEVVKGLQSDSPELRRVVLKLSANDDATVRSQAFTVAKEIKDDPDALIKVVKAIFESEFDNTGGEWSSAANAVLRYKNDKAIRQAIPAMAKVLRNKLDSKPYRGFFTDGAHYMPMDIMLAQWDATIEAIPDVVPGLCRTHVRVPFSKYKGWVRTRDYAWKLLNKCTKKSVNAILATVAEEKAWLAQVDDVKLKETTEAEAIVAREKCAGFIRELEELAEKLKKQ